MQDVRIQFLKEQAKLNAAQSKILRKYEKHCKRYANETRKESNSKKTNQWDSRREDTYTARKAIGQEARYTHLARAFAIQKDYLDIEHKTKPNNIPHADKLVSKLVEFGFRVNPSDVELWLEVLPLTPRPGPWYPAHSTNSLTLANVLTQPIPTKSTPY